MERQEISEQEKLRELEIARERDEEARREYEKNIRGKYLQNGDFRKFAKQGLEDRKTRMAQGANFKDKWDKSFGPATRGKKGEKTGGAKNAKDLAKAGRAALTAFSEISFSKDASYFLVITISILADLFSLVPILGSVIAVLFAILIWMIYMISGHFRVKAAQQTISLVVAALFEIFPGLNILPFFTASAIINYWIALAAKKAKKIETQENAENRK